MYPTRTEEESEKLEICDLAGHALSKVTCLAVDCRGESGERCADRRL